MNDVMQTAGTWVAVAEALGAIAAFVFIAAMILAWCITLLTEHVARRGRR
tara:strand:+ start:25703 stop:25852 length:150 start_codon:yes stop_codon:yes gene_type:complete